MRLFVALDLPDDVRRALSGVSAGLKPKSRAPRWVQPENLHVTLKFIGHVETGKLRPIQDALAAIHSPRPVDMHFHGIGFFPNERRPCVVWARIAASPNLPPLVADIDCALTPLGVESESRAFTPHLTLARLKSHQGLGDLLTAANVLKSCEFGRARATNFHLYESILKSTGAQYNRLASFPIVSGSTAEAN